MSDAQVRVYLVDSAGQAAGLLQLIGDRSELLVVGRNSDIEAALEDIRGTDPDIILIGADLEGRGVVSATEVVRSVAPEAATLVLAGPGDKTLVRAAVMAGAAGSVSRTATPDELVDALLGRHRQNLGLPAHEPTALPPVSKGGPSSTAGLPTFPTGTPGAPPGLSPAPTAPTPPPGGATPPAIPVAEVPAVAEEPAAVPDDPLAVAGLREEARAHPVKEKRRFGLFGRGGSKKEPHGKGERLDEAATPPPEADTEPLAAAPPAPGAGSPAGDASGPTVADYGSQAEAEHKLSRKELEELLRRDAEVELNRLRSEKKAESEARAAADARAEDEEVSS